MEMYLHYVPYEGLEDFVDKSLVGDSSIFKNKDIKL